MLSSVIDVVHSSFIISLTLSHRLHYLHHLLDTHVPVLSINPVTPLSYTQAIASLVYVCSMYEQTLNIIINIIVISDVIIIVIIFFALIIFCAFCSCLNVLCHVAHLTLSFDVFIILLLLFLSISFRKFYILF